MSKLNATFKRWFGDSVVVDENQDPLVVYHGTLADFKKFDMSKAGERFPAHKTEGAMWFSESPDEAAGYTDYDTYDPDHKPKGGVVMPCYLKIENPVVVDAAKVVQSDLYVKLSGGKKVYEIRYVKKRIVQYAKEDGHDGVIFLNGYDNVPTLGALFAVFKANQIKSAIGNDGTWDSDDEDVRSNPKSTTKTAMADIGKWVPKSFKLNLEDENCLGNAARLVRANKKLRYVEGYVKGPGERWPDQNEHAWAETPDGRIVDPYFRVRLPSIWDKIQYREDERAFK